VSTSPERKGVTAWSLDPATAEPIAQAVNGCPGVASLSPGEMGEVATYLPGRRVIGIRLRDSIEVHVVARFGVTVEDLARQVRAAVATVAPGPVVDVYVDDVDVELTEQSAPDGSTESGGALAASAS